MKNKNNDNKVLINQNVPSNTESQKTENQNVIPLRKIINTNNHIQYISNSSYQKRDNIDKEILKLQNNIQNRNQQNEEIDHPKPLITSYDGDFDDLKNQFHKVEEKEINNIKKSYKKNILIENDLINNCKIDDNLKLYNNSGKKILNGINKEKNIENKNSDNKDKIIGFKTSFKNNQIINSRKMNNNSSKKTLDKATMTEPNYKNTIKEIQSTLASSKNNNDSIYLKSNNSIKNKNNMNNRIQKLKAYNSTKFFNNNIRRNDNKHIKGLVHQECEKNYIKVKIAETNQNPSINKLNYQRCINQTRIDYKKLNLNKIEQIPLKPKTMFQNNNVYLDSTIKENIASKNLSIIPSKVIKVQKIDKKEKSLSPQQNFNNTKTKIIKISKKSVPKQIFLPKKLENKNMFTNQCSPFKSRNCQNLSISHPHNPRENKSFDNNNKKFTKKRINIRQNRFPFVNQNSNQKNYINSPNTSLKKAHGKINEFINNNINNQQNLIYDYDYDYDYNYYYPNNIYDQFIPIEYNPRYPDNNYYLDIY